MNTLPDAELTSLITQASRYFDLVCGVSPNYFDPAYYPVWESLHTYVVGDIVTPTTRNLHKYRVTTAGTSGASEPTFPTGSGATVTNGTVVFTENGADVVATSQTIYGQGTSYLRLPPYVPGTLNTTITVPTNYVAPDFIEKDGYLILTDTDGVLPQGQWRYPPYAVGWFEGVAITVSAVWGYASTPEDVKMAVIELAIVLWRETDPANMKILDITSIVAGEGVFGRALPPRVLRVVSQYRPKVGAAFA